jgi:hypothetical protein
LENVPIALVSGRSIFFGTPPEKPQFSRPHILTHLFSWQFLIAVLESNRAGPKAIHGLLGTLFAARVLHGNFGMFWNATALGNGRLIGFMTTNAVIAVAAIWNGVIGRQVYLGQL